MKRIRSEKRKVRPERWRQQIFPLDPRDPDIAGAKAIVYGPGVPR